MKDFAAISSPGRRISLRCHCNENTIMNFQNIVFIYHNKILEFISLYNLLAKIQKRIQILHFPAYFSYLRILKNNYYRIGRIPKTLMTLNDTYP